MRHTSQNGIRNTEGNQAVTEFREAHPLWSWQEIGDQFGISKQCAHAIYKRATGHKGYGYGGKPVV